MLKKALLAGVGIALLASPLVASASTLSDLEAQLQSLLQELDALQMSQPAAAAAAVTATTTPTGTLSVTGCTTSVAGGTCPVAVSYTTQNTLNTNGKSPRSQVNVYNASNVTYIDGGVASSGVNFFPNTASNSASFSLNLPVGSYLFRLYGLNGINWILLQKQTIAVSLSQVASLVATSPNPAYTIVSGGATGVTVGSFTLQPSAASVQLQNIALELNSNFASSSDLVNGQVSIMNGSTVVGTVSFAGVTPNASKEYVATTTISNFNLPQNVQTTFTLRANISPIGTGQSGTSGHEILVGLADAQGAAVNMSINSGPATQPTQGNGIAIFRSYPTQVSLVSLPTSGLSADRNLIEFSVTANSQNPVGIDQFVFSFASSTGVTISNPALYYSSTGGTPSTLASNSGGSNATTYSASNQTAVMKLQSPIEIPAGATYTFLLQAGSIVYTGSNGLYNITTTLRGDSTDLSPVMVAANAAAASTYNFVWSPNSTKTSATSVKDWTDGYGVNGLPSFGISETITSTGSVSSSTQPSATIDQSSLAASSSPVTITGTATGVSPATGGAQLEIVLNSNNPGNPGNIVSAQIVSATNGRWSASLGNLSAGTYTVTVYAAGTGTASPLATGTFTVTGNNSTSSTSASMNFGGEKDAYTIGGPFSWSVNVSNAPSDANVCLVLISSTNSNQQWGVEGIGAPQGCYAVSGNTSQTFAGTLSTVPAGQYYLQATLIKGGGYSGATVNYASAVNSPVFTINAAANNGSLTSTQISAIVSRLQSFGPSSGILSEVQSALTGVAVTPSVNSTLTAAQSQAIISLLQSFGFSAGTSISDIVDDILTYGQTITVDVPSANQTFAQGDTVGISWNDTFGTPTTQYYIMLWPSTYPAGSGWTLAGVDLPTATGSNFSWSVGTYPAGSYIVRVCRVGEPVCGQSAVFKLGPQTTTSLQIAPTISGSVTGYKSVEVRVFAYPNNSAEIIYDNTDVPVVNGQYSVTVTPPLPSLSEYYVAQVIGNVGYSGSLIKEVKITLSPAN